MIIQCRDLYKSYKKRPVVQGVSINVAQGEVVGLLGPNGAGKTTTFYMTVGLVSPSKGSVFLDDEDITSWPMYRRARAGIGYLPQEASVFRKLTVRDNLQLVLELKGISKEKIPAEIDRLASELHVSHILDQLGNTLSGGERRLVEIARALASDPKFILLDEPFAGIDPKTIEEIQLSIQHLKARGIGILITDHNVSATLGITDRNYILIDGKILAEGDAKTISADEGVRKFYLGSQFGSDATSSDDTSRSPEAQG
jgi:lipopolysaccharide export system ATP-binding protein